MSPKGNEAQSTGNGAEQASGNGHNGFVIDPPDEFAKRPRKLNERPTGERSPYPDRSAKVAEDAQYGSPEAACTVGGVYAAEHGVDRGKLARGTRGYETVAQLGSVSLAHARATGLVDRDHRPSVADVAKWYAGLDPALGWAWEPETPATVATVAGLKAAIKGLDPDRRVALTTIEPFAAEGVPWAVSAKQTAAADNLDTSVRDKTYSFTLTQLDKDHGAGVEDVIDLPPMNPETRLASLQLLRDWAADETERSRDGAKSRLAAASAPVIELPPITSLADLLAEDDDPVRMRIEQVWPMGGAKGSLAAPAGAGKTNFNINLICSLADCEPFLGAFDVHPTDVRIAVIDLEMNKPMTRRWLRRRGVRNLDAVVDVVNLRGNPGLFDMGNDRLRDMWARRLRDQGVNFVTFDCLKPVLDIMGLNENTEMGKFLTPFDVMLTEAQVDDVLVYHHTGHASGAAGERARGDSTLLGWTDVNLKIIRNDDGDRFFAASKVRDAEEPAPEGLLTFDPAAGRLTYTGENRAATAVTENIEKRMHAVLDVLADAATDGTDEMNATAIRSAVGGKNDITDRALMLAKERGLVTQRCQGRSRLYRILPKAASDAMYAGDDSGLNAVPDNDIAEVVAMRSPRRSGRKAE
ncbi:hypothetical protein MINTM001_23420 [Mycobacterium paraintracellulare]|uniref:AAA family ATPase n=1 Tax=Mycobacterium paraintracellulare TaxID=1138383 RepID=UPI001927CC6C|nr:AAA family ATPase [Mycobacterium paraintracellulare]BCO41203.1 hypothetical protein MINTM001_23420 [Mycobacterium paraintracellulare]